MKKQQPYHVFLLRCWCESDANSVTHTWRFSLERVQDSQRNGFADLQALLTFLQKIVYVEEKLDREDVPH